MHAINRFAITPLLMLVASGGGVLLWGCDTSESPELLDLTVQLEPPAWGYQIATEPVRVEPFDEVTKCSVVRVEPEGDELDVWVNRFETLSSESTHHMNVLLGQFSFLDAFLGEDAFENQLGIGLGTFDCEDLDNLMATAVPIVPSQRASQLVTMPDGVGIPMVAPLVLVMEHHYLNLRDEPALINAALNVERVDPAEVEQVAGFIFDDILDLEVPAGGQQVMSRTCGMNRDVEFAVVSTHTHQRTDCATLNRYTAATDEVAASPFFVNKTWETPPILHFGRDTFALSAGDGVHWACHYRDWRGDGIVNDGTAGGEMCVFAAVAYPAPRTKEDIVETLSSGDLLAIYGLVDDLMSSCDEHPEVPGPWAHSEEAFFGDPLEACADFDQTESNTLE